MLFAFQPTRACIFDISADQNVWLRSALRSFRLYGNTLFCDCLRLFAICDRLRLYGNQPLDITSEMAEAFNCHFANIGHDLAREIPSADTVPERYLISTNATFSFKCCSSNEVRKLLKKLDRDYEIDWTGQFAIHDA